MKARFIGDPRNGGEGPSGLSLFGAYFNRETFTTVPEGAEAKIAGNSHFEVETDKPQLDHDHDGKAGGSLPKRRGRRRKAAK